MHLSSPARRGTIRTTLFGCILLGTAAHGDPLAQVSGGASPGDLWNYTLQSTLGSVEKQYSSSYAGFSAAANGGSAPSVNASVWATSPHAYQAQGMANARGEVHWSYRIVPGNPAWATNLVPVTMGYETDLRIAAGWGYYSGAGSTASIWTEGSLGSGTGSSDWGVASGGGWTISWTLSQPYGGNPDHFTAGGTRTFFVSYNSWIGIQIMGSTGATAGRWDPDKAPNPTASGRAFVDPTMSLSAAWLAAHPGDTIEYQSPEPPPPTLSVQRTSTNTVVHSWPLQYPAWKLHYATNLSATATWTEVTPPYGTNGTSLFFLDPAPAGRRFYRLHKP